MIRMGCVGQVDELGFDWAFAVTLTSKLIVSKLAKSFFTAVDKCNVGKLKIRNACVTKSIHRI